MQCTDVMHKCGNLREIKVSVSKRRLSLPHALYTTFLARSHQIQKAALLAFMRDDFLGEELKLVA